LDHRIHIFGAETSLLWLNWLYSTMVADVIPARSRISGDSDVSTRVGIEKQILQFISQ